MLTLSANLGRTDACRAWGYQPKSLAAGEPQMHFLVSQPPLCRAPRRRLRDVWPPTGICPGLGQNHCSLMTRNQKIKMPFHLEFKSKTRLKLNAALWSSKKTKPI